MASKSRRREYQNRPKWANRKKIREIYRHARLVGKQVDHVIPLNHPYVSGLHVEYNLKILTEDQNLAKTNKYHPDQLELFKTLDIEQYELNL